MNKKITFTYVLALFLFGQGLIEAEQNNVVSSNSMYESSYTSIAQKDCQTLESDNLGSIEECESFAGMKVIVIEGDTKQGIILTRDNKRYELDFGSLVSQGFISLNSDLEWRYKRQEFDNPRAMILRLEVNEDEDDVEKVTSYALISKITENEICVVGKIKTEENQDELVRKMAEEAISMPCLSSIK
jgi:hypothetical protein